MALDVNTILELDIPHRVRSALARMKRLRRELGPVKDWNPKTPKEKIARRCETDAIWEGRLTAIRWLIELVGVKMRFDDKKSVWEPAVHKTKYSTDLRLDKLPGGNLIDPNSAEGQKLAEIWRGCSQGSGHATQSTGHPAVDELDLNPAIDIILDHLQTTVYAKAGKNLIRIALQPSA